MMRQLALVTAFVCVPSLAFALDPIVNANADLSCATAGGETFYPYGDVWAFLSGGACKGVDPTGYNLNLDAEAAEKTDTAGHCIWVGFDKDGPIRQTGSTGTTADHAERARKVVFGSMRKWAGFRMGEAKLGGDGFNWYCPSTSQPTPTDATKPISYTTKVDYTFNLGNSVQPSFNFFRGPDVDNAISGVANKGDTYECYAECIAGQSCAGLTTVMLENKTLYTCTDGKTQPGTERNKVKKARHNVIWVKGAGNWKTQSGAGPEVLASTEVVFWQDVGVIITADMLINNENQDWEFNDPAKPDDPPEGCNGNATNCYFLETVVTHESGHFLGFGHVNCSDAVMVPSAKTTDRKFDLSKHEAAGVCSLYRPSSEGRYPTTTREGDGCLTNAACGAGFSCLFSKQAYYQTEAELASAPSDQERFPHRGICVKAGGCMSDSDCDPSHGRVCQETDASTAAKNCIAGSPGRSRGGAVADYCTPCDTGSQCNGICAATSDMGITLSTGDTPAHICSSKCDPAIGCGQGFTCQKVGPIYACVPNDPASCITNAVASTAALNEDCSQTQCAAGLTCYGFSDTVGVCLEACSKTVACKTPGYGCLLKLTQDDSGKVVQLDDGACFKKDMKEGDNCALSTNAMCGLGCTGSGTAEVCVRNDKRLCIAADPNQPDQAKCYTICSANLACAQTTQTCAIVGDPALGGLQANGSLAGVCDPPTTGLCLKGVGETCVEATDCDTGQCLSMGDVTACTQFCDLANRSGCPLGTNCTSVGGKALCKPDPSQKLTPRCVAPNTGCSCSSLSSSSVLEVSFALLALAVWRRRKRNP